MVNYFPKYLKAKIKRNSREVPIKVEPALKLTPRHKVRTNRKNQECFPFFIKSAMFPETAVSKI